MDLAMAVDMPSTAARISVPSLFLRFSGIHQLSAVSLRARPGSARWTATLIALAAVGALSIDLSLPAQPAFARAFVTDAKTAQLTLSVFLLGYGLAQLFVGYLSDALGRRRVLLAGLALFTVSGLI